jgi:hypothetical protein
MREKGRKEPYLDFRLVKPRSAPEVPVEKAAPLDGIDARTSGDKPRRSLIDVIRKKR